MTEPTSQPRRDVTPAVYGSLLVTTLVAVQWRGSANPELIALSLIVSVLVFWATHVWSRLVSHRVSGPIDRATAVAIGRHEAPMLSAAIIPALILAAARPLGIDLDQVIGAALLASIAQLFLWGLAVGRASDSTWAMSLLIAVVDVLLGLVIVVLKVIVLH